MSSAGFDRNEFEHFAAQLMEQQFERVPQMRAFHAGTWIERDYYVRHLVETLLRIRLNNEVDAFALYRIGSSDDHLAAILAQYLGEEYGHEHMFMRDVKQFGLTEKQVDEIGVFCSTEQLMGYLRLAAEREGPAPTTIWNFFVEWYSDRYNRIITDHAADVYGLDLVRGSNAHLEFDESHDHDDLMWKTVNRAVTNWSSPEKAYRYLETFVRLVGDYFTELYESTRTGVDARRNLAVVTGH